MARINASKILYWLAGSFAAVVAIASLVLSFLDWDQYRDTLSDLASSQMDMRVEVEGAITLAIFPRPSFSAESVRLFPNTEGFNDAVATAERISFKLGFSSFLQGRFSLQSVTLDGLQLTLEEKANRHWRVRGWPEVVDDGAAGPEIELSRFDLSGGRITVVRLGAKPFALEGVNVKISGGTLKGTVNWQGDFTVKGQKIQSSGKVRPISARDEIALNTELVSGSTTASLVGRIQTGADFTGRLKIDSAKLGEFSETLASIGGFDIASIPDLPLKLDLQIDKKGSIIELVSRSFTFEETRARLDLTIATNEQQRHVNGTLSLGVINFDNWTDALPDITQKIDDIELSESTPAVVDSGWTGSIDLNIEGIKVKGGLGQRIDAVVAFNPQGAYISRLQALLPGATNVVFAGKLASRQGDGNFQIHIGKISDLADWVGLPLPANISAGRLTTASFKGEIGLTQSGWNFSQVEGLFDTTKVKGALSGSYGSFKPRHVKVSADSVNLDAYFPIDAFTRRTTDADKKTATATATLNSSDLEFDLSIENLQWLNESFSDVRIVGTQKRGQITLNHAMMAQGEGSFSLTGNVRPGKRTAGADATAVDVSIAVKSWQMPYVRYLVPELRKPLLALGFTAVDGTFTAVGPLNELRIGLELKNNNDVLAFAGVVGAKSNKLVSTDMQGSLMHADIAPLARTLNLVDVKLLPIRATASLFKTAADKPLVLKVSGELAGGNLVASSEFGAGQDMLEGVYNHNNTGALVDMLGVPDPGLDRSANLRSEFSYSRDNETNDWSLSVPNFRNGNLSVSGTIHVSGSAQVDGEIRISGGEFSGTNNRKSTGQPSRERLEKLADYAGRLSISVSNTKIAGQSLDIPNATFILGDRSAQFTLGEEATLNAEPATFDATANLDGDFPFEGSITVAKLDVGQLLASEGISAAVKVHTSLESSFSGLGGDGEILRSIKMGGSTTGGVGELNFISANAIAKQVQAATSNRSFLGKIGTLLRTGTTVAKTIESRFSIDSGVMLVETAKAAGDWGEMAVNGQVNFLDEYLTLKGNLSLSKPQDVPVIPVTYEGNFASPTIRWSSRVFERFVFAGIERRLRARLFKDIEKREAESGKVGDNPGLAVFSRAFGLLDTLREAQRAKKRQKEDAAVAAAKDVVQ